jgi:Fe-Mn family superoxide dismutase
LTPKPIQLLPLPFSYSALEPDISAQTVRLHHDVHQAGYVRGANEAMRVLHELDAEPNRFPAPTRAAMRRAITEDLAFQLGGVRLHELYWAGLSPTGGGAPTGDLARAISRHFGSFSGFRTAFADLVSKLQGSGWVILVYEPRTGSLLLESVGDHENRVLHDAVPIVVCDVWEHAYYLDHPADRSGYLEAFFRRVSWDEAQRRFDEARRCSPS